MDELKSKTLSGLFYKFAERIGVQVVTFIVSVILARLLLPEQFGTITLVSVFITILDVFVTFGFGNSLVVNKNSDDLDFSTCFHFGLAFAIILYIIVWFCAPYLSVFFDMSEITSLIRVMALRIPIGAVNSIQHAYVSKLMIFKKFFISTSIGTIVSAFIALVMAYQGFGVWALVAQYLGNVILDTLCLSFIVDWRPKMKFSFSRLKAIYDYGWKILLVGLIDTIYGQLRNFVIAKKYSAADLAYYGKGLSFPNMGITTVEPTIDGVIFPALSNCNDDPTKMKSITRRIIKSTTYFIFPLMIGLMALGKPLIIVLLSEKWIESVVYLHICCLALIFRPIQVINNCVIRASGDSTLLLRLDIIKKSVGMVLLVASIPFGVKAVAFSLVIVNLFSTVINIMPNRRILNYGCREQLRDIIPNLLLSLAMGAITWAVSFLGYNYLVTLFLQFTVGVIGYLCLSVIFKSESFYYIMGYIKKMVKHTNC